MHPRQFQIQFLDHNDHVIDIDYYLSHAEAFRAINRYQLAHGTSGGYRMYVLVEEELSTEEHYG